MWYISHHSVYHKVKNKLRVVFNCSLKYNGISLNDNLLQGPDLTNSLFAVPIRFRQENIAFAADIESMFYQVKIPENDSNLMRFFWYNRDFEKVEEYRLRVHVFGATASPSIANFALRETVNTNDCSIETKNSILRNFYVDDLLKSVERNDTAVELAKDIKSKLFECGFNLRNFVSNSPEFQKELSSDHCEERVVANKPTDAVTSIPADTSALGVTWNTEKDELGLKITIKPGNEITKRIVLRTLASVYDPLGISTPVIIPAKRIFQECCKLHLGWDEEIPGDLQKNGNHG